jgi:hypothetical protein
MVGVAQLVRVPDCDSGCRGFESHRPPQFSRGRGKFRAARIPRNRAGRPVPRGLLRGLEAWGSTLRRAQRRYLIEAVVLRLGATALKKKSGPLAQLVEQQTLNLLVLGSSPRRPTTFPPGRPRHAPMAPSRTREKGSDSRAAREIIAALNQAKVAELVDALDLGSSGATRESSSLSFRTTIGPARGRNPVARRWRQADQDFEEQSCKFP